VHGGRQAAVGDVIGVAEQGECVGDGDGQGAHTERDSDRKNPSPRRERASLIEALASPQACFLDQELSMLATLALPRALDFSRVC